MSKFGTSRIKKEHIPETLRNFSEVSGISIEDLVLLGSTGKQADSGDIDIALCSTKYSPEQIHKQLISTYQGTFNTGNLIGSYVIPTQVGETVQLDLMYVSNVEWAQFSYFSAGDKSQYKGAVRTLLLMGVAAALDDKKYTKFIYNDQGQLMFRCGLTFDLNHGLHSICQYRKTKRDGSLYKNLTTISFNQANEVFPNATVGVSRYEELDPSSALTFLFKQQTTPKDVETAEQVLELINTSFSRQHANVIYDRTAARAIGVVDKMVLPDELYNRIRG